MYNISLKNLLENHEQRLEWKSSDAHRQLCTLKGKQESDCQNYIRVYARIDDHKIMICGTNSFKPLCRYYKKAGEIRNDAMSSIALVQENETTENDANANKNNEETSLSSNDEQKNSDIYQMINEVDGQGRCPYNPTHNSSYIFTG